MDLTTVAAFNAALRVKKLTIVCAESITAGLLASTIASISGASDVLNGSIVTYSRKLKTAILGVDPSVIDTHTAESAETTAEMAKGLVKIYPDANIFVAVTGVASKPANDYVVKRDVGQIYVAVWYNNELHEEGTVIQGTERNAIREKTVEFIFDFILKIIN